jgi:hypothetical protein
MDTNEFERRLRTAGWTCAGWQGWHEWTAPDGCRVRVRHGGRWSTVPKRFAVRALRRRHDLEG